MWSWDPLFKHFTHFTTYPHLLHLFSKPFFQKVLFCNLHNFKHFRGGLSWSFCFCVRHRSHAHSQTGLYTTQTKHAWRLFHFLSLCTATPFQLTTLQLACLKVTGFRGWARSNHRYALLCSAARPLKISTSRSTDLQCCPRLSKDSQILFLLQQYGTGWIRAGQFTKVHCTLLIC